MAKNRIRGITVEIGGDMTKLDKALSGTNKTIQTTQDKLKDVERLLKLDPKNVELLGQKQRLLAQAAEATADKFKTLKDVADKATVSDEKYAEWQSALASLQGQITNTASSLTDLQKRQQELEEQGFAPDSSEMVELQEQIDSTREKMEELQASVTETYEAMGNPISTEQWDDLQRELAEAQEAARSAQEELDSFDPELEEIGSTADDVSDKAGKVADATSGLSAAAGGLLTAMMGTVPATEEFRSSLSKVEANAKAAGISLDAMDDALKQLNRVSDDTGTSVEALSNLMAAGVTESNLQRAVENLAGAAIKFPDTVTIESLADGLQETLATGEAAGQFAEVLDRLGIGAEAFNAQLAQVPGEANKLNFALDTLAQEGMADLYGAWAESNQAMVDNKDASLELMQSLSDMGASLEPIVTAITGFATKLLDWFNSLSPATKTVIVGILGVTASISPIAGLISNIGGAVSTVSKVVGMFSSGPGEKMYLTFVKWSVIILAIVAAIALLIAMINVLLDKGDQMTSAMNSVSNVTSSIGGGISGAGNAYGRSGTAALAEYPHFAAGGVFAPNNPMLGVLGDNRTETEIAAPESALKETFLEALRDSGASGGQRISVSVQFTGSLAQLGRVLNPVITAEGGRLGPQLVD